MTAPRMTWRAMCLALMIGCWGCTSEPETPPLATAEDKPQAPAVARGRIQFTEGFRRGVDTARQQGKPMLVFFTATWCDYCHAMANEAFCQDAVVNLSERFTCILVDADRESDVCREFRVRGYPTIQFLSPRGLPLNRVTGKQPGHQLVMEMQAALQAVARRVDDAGGNRSL